MEAAPPLQVQLLSGAPAVIKVPGPEKVTSNAIPKVPGEPLGDIEATLEDASGNLVMEVGVACGGGGACCFICSVF
jgi:hypothetical protein